MLENAVREKTLGSSEMLGAPSGSARLPYVCK